MKPLSFSSPNTVSFLHTKLPHTLIESFKATLEEVVEADLLIHVVDLSHPRVDEHIEAVDTVVKELGAFGKQTLVVFNKIDALANDELIGVYTSRFPGSVAISARKGTGVSGWCRRSRVNWERGGCDRVSGFRRARRD